MKLLSINVGLPREVNVEGKQVTTAIFKAPVSGPVAVHSLNIQGDRQANLEVHGGPDKAVYLYPWENIRYWAGILQREDLGPGSFGENLTVEGLSEIDTAIGDEISIGSARFLVTQPRLPCFKLALALETPTLPKAFLESGRTGFYLRVTQEGTIEAGDSVCRFPAQEPGRVTIAEIVELYRNQRATREQAGKILSLAALPAKWKQRIAASVTENPSSA